MKKIHYAWIMSIVCALVLICTNGLTISIMGTYLPFIQEQGYSGTATSTLVTLRSLAAMMTMFLAPRIYQKISLRCGITCCCGCISLVLFLMAGVKSYFAYAVCVATLGALYGLGAMIPLTLLLSNWFESHRATALSICTLGTGLSSMVMPPVVTAAAQKVSLAAALEILSAISFVVMLIAVSAIRNKPEDIGATPYHTEDYPSKKRVRIPRAHYQLNRIQNLAMIIAVVLLGAVAMASCAHYAVWFTTSGYTKDQAALAIALMGFGNIAGKAAYGPLIERVGSKKAALISLSILAVGCVFCVLAPLSEFFMYGSCLIMGLGFPPATVGISIWADDFSTSKSYANVLRNYQMAYVAGGALYSFIPGLIYDFTESYMGAYVSFVVFVVFIALIVVHTYSCAPVVNDYQREINFKKLCEYSKGQDHAK